MVKKLVLLLHIICFFISGCSQIIRHPNANLSKTNGNIINAENTKYSENCSVKCIEYTVRLDNGKIIIITQKNNFNLSIGQRVQVCQNRITPMQ